MNTASNTYSCGYYPSKILEWGADSAADTIRYGSAATFVVSAIAAIIIFPSAALPLATVTGSMFVARLLTSQKILQLVPSTCLQNFQETLNNGVEYIEKNYPKLPLITLVFTLVAIPFSSTLAMTSAIAYGAYTGIWIKNMIHNDANEENKDRELKAEDSALNQSVVTF